MESADNKNQVVEEANKPTRVPYESASESCKPLDSLVPLSFAKEQIFFNRTLKTETGDVDEYVVKKLKYKSVDDLCKAFAREQIDAIATAIYNWEATGNAIIVSDQTGLGKGRIVAGLIRYSILNLREYPVFFTEKKNLFSDIYRDLFDIGLDAAIVTQVKKEVIKPTEEELSDKVILKEIRKDIRDEELRIDYELPSEDYKLKNLLDDEEIDVDELIELYRQYIIENGFVQGRGYEKVQEALSPTQIKNVIKADIESGGTIRFVEATPSQIANLFNKSEASFLKKVIDAYEKNLSTKRMTEDAKEEGRIRVFPFCPFELEIKNKSGDILYKVTAAEGKNFVENQNLEAKYKSDGLLLLMYSSLSSYILSESGELLPKGKFVFERCRNRVVILDEAHNAAGTSNRARVIERVLRQAKYVSYVSATWAKRPDNMPIYAVRTAIKDSFLSSQQLVNAFTNGGLALQEAVSSNLVQDGQLIRREKEIEGGLPTYYTEDDTTNTGLNQISKLNGVASTWRDIQFESADFKASFNQAKEGIDIQIEGVALKEAKKRFKTYGSVKSQLSRIFSYFLLGIKVNQTAEKAIEQLEQGRKVVISIGNTLESALQNMRKNYLEDIGYVLGDNVPNDFAEVLKMVASKILQFKYTGRVRNDMGEYEPAEIIINLWEHDSSKSTGNENVDRIAREMQNEWLDRMNDFLNRIRKTNISLAPIDQINALIEAKGFRVDEITGRTTKLKFMDTNDFSFGVYSKRNKPLAIDVVNKFNNNELDCLFINQSGATGLSLHALPTMLQGKIVPPVNIIPNPPIPPNSLTPDNEVKQRCMIILQQEYNVSTEVQKLGRINRNGQVFPPKYIYITSAIPSEARLSAMMQRKLQSLMATTAGSQEFGSDLFSYDDLFSDYAVDPWNKTCVQERLPLADYGVSKGDQILSKSKLLYLLPYDQQKNFFIQLLFKLKANIASLREKGEYFQAIQYKDYKAKSQQIIPFIIGNNEAISVFGKHTFAELNDVITYGAKNYESLITSEIESNLQLDFDGDTRKFESYDDFVQTADSSTMKMIESYNSSYSADILREEQTINTIKEHLGGLQTELKKFPDLEKIISLENQRDEKQKEDNKLAEEITKLIRKGEDASNISRQIQQVSKELEELDEKLNKLLVDYKGKTSKEIDVEKKSLERAIKNDEREIESSEKAIARNKEVISNQIKFQKIYMDFIKTIGKIYDVEILTEEIVRTSEDNYDDDAWEYKYSVNRKEPMVLTRVVFNQNRNFYFTLGNINLEFHSVTNRVDFNASNVYGEMSEKSTIHKKRNPYVLNVTDTFYENNWAEIVNKVDTSTISQKVMLSGDLLRGLAFNSLTNYSGNIVKYSTSDNKLKISLELNEASTKTVLPRFNEGLNYPILVGLSDDNCRRLLPYMLAKRILKRFSFYMSRDYYENENFFLISVSTQFLYSNSNVYLTFYPNESLFNLISSYYDSQLTDSYLKTDDESDEYKAILNQMTSIIRENLNDLRFCISSDEPEFLSAFENVLSNNDRVAEHSRMQEKNKGGLSLAYSDNSAQYAVFEATDALKDDKKMSANANVFPISLNSAYAMLKVFDKNQDGDLYTGVYILNPNTMDIRSNGGNPYFRPIYNLSLTYEALLVIINFLQAKNTQVIAVTSADPVFSAEPKYIFNIESSTKGIINDIDVESIDTLGNDMIQAIEDVINEFVALYA